jgi:hypothetical protein
VKVVDRLEQFPATCLVTGNTQGPFVDFEANYDQAQVALHVEVVRQAARKLGMVDAPFLSETLEKLEQAQAELREKAELIAQAQAVLDFRQKMEEATDASAA